jgi:hypothetical protein
MGRIRRVRTPEGSRRFGLPIGAPIVPGAGAIGGLAVPRHLEVPEAPGRQPNPFAEDAIARMPEDLARRTREAIDAGALPAEAVGWAEVLGAPELAADEDIQGALAAALSSGIGPDEVAWVRRHRRRLAELGYGDKEPWLFQLARWAVAAERISGTDPGPEVVAQLAMTPRASILPPEAVARVAADAAAHPDIDWEDVLSRLHDAYPQARELEADPRRAIERAERWKELIGETRQLTGAELARLEERFGGDPERTAWLTALRERYLGVPATLAFAANLDDAHFEALLAEAPKELGEAAMSAAMSARDDAGPGRAAIAAQVANMLDPGEVRQVLERGGLLGLPGMDRLDPVDARGIIRQVPPGTASAPLWETAPLLSAMASRGEVARLTELATAGREAIMQGRAGLPRLAGADSLAAAVRARDGSLLDRWLIARELALSLGRPVPGSAVAERILDGADPWEALGLPGPDPAGWADLPDLAEIESMEGELPSPLYRLPAVAVRPGLGRTVERLRREGLADDHIVWVLSSPEGLDRYQRTKGAPHERAEAATLVGSAAAAYDEARAAGADHLTAWRRALGVPESPEALGATRAMPPADVEAETSVELAHRGLLFVQREGDTQDPAVEKAHVVRNLTALLPPHARAALAAVVQDRGTRADQAAVSELVRQWAMTANDAEPVPLAIQRRMERLFGLEGAARWKIDRRTEEEVRRVERRLGPWVDMVAAAMYRSTQDLFAREGVSELPLWRGWNWTESARPAWAAKLGEAAVPHRPLVSYSFSPEVARNFSAGELGSITAAVVPASRIIATPRTGFGCRDEREFVVLGGALPTTVGQARGGRIVVEAAEKGKGKKVVTA